MPTIDLWQQQLDLKSPKNDVQKYGPTKVSRLFPCLAFAKK